MSFDSLDINNIVDIIDDVIGNNTVNDDMIHQFNYVDFGDKFLNVFYRLSELYFDKFVNLFEKTMHEHQLFLNKQLNNVSVKVHINSCQFLYFLELMLIFNENIQELSVSSIFKVHNGCIFVDDSTVIDKETNQLRLTLGTENEPLRGLLLYKSWNNNTRHIILQRMHHYSFKLKLIIRDIFNKKYDLFNIGHYLYNMSSYLYSNSNFHGLTLLSSEINNKSFELSNDEKLILFDSINNINELWTTDVFKMQSKLRIIVMYIYSKKYLS